MPLPIVVRPSGAGFPGPAVPLHLDHLPELPWCPTFYSSQFYSRHPYVPHGAGIKWVSLPSGSFQSSQRACWRRGLVPRPHSSNVTRLANKACAAPAYSQPCSTHWFPSWLRMCFPMKIKRLLAMHLQDSLKPVEPSLGLMQRPGSQGKYGKLGELDQGQSRGALGWRARNAELSREGSLKPRR